MRIEKPIVSFSLRSVSKAEANGIAGYKSSSAPSLTVCEVRRPLIYHSATSDSGKRSAGSSRQHLRTSDKICSENHDNDLSADAALTSEKREAFG